MYSLRLHDPGRRPSSWTEIIQPSEFAVFAKDLDTGLPCDADGRPFADPAAATCLVFDSIADARAFCEAQVLTVKRLQLDVFDAQGRANSPLVTVLHPSRADAAETSPRVLRRRRRIAWGLLLAGLPMLAIGYQLNEYGHGIFPGFIGLSLILGAGRMFWFDLAVKEAERDRKRRLEEL